jgi:hypothetical protein
VTAVVMDSARIYIGHVTKLIIRTSKKYEEHVL